jgi:hypothetical protein
MNTTAILNYTPFDALPYVTWFFGWLIFIIMIVLLLAVIGTLVYMIIEGLL